MRNKFRQTAQQLAIRLKAIEFDRLPISEYNKRYIRNLKLSLPYYMKIYATCLHKGFQATGLSLKETTLIDYGGGSGFLSMLAKQAGVGQVIYIDLNPDSVETIRILKEQAGTGPDIILHGSSDTLEAWCSENKIKPQLLIATDLIEHVYDLPAFFTDLIAINDRMQMLFTTASTPFNPYVKRRLHRLMVACEKGTAISPNYYTLRLEHIKENFPALPTAEAEEAARKTRGLTYPDIRKAVGNGSYPSLEDSFNTCDPRNGNWTERILPIHVYRSLVKPAGYLVQVEKGFYNTDRSNPMAAFVCKGINCLIGRTGKAGLLLAPFIILHLRRE